jgi:hypothetical protein
MLLRAKRWSTRQIHGHSGGMIATSTMPQRTASMSMNRFTKLSSTTATTRRPWRWNQRLRYMGGATRQRRAKQRQAHIQDVYGVPTAARRHRVFPQLRCNESLWRELGCGWWAAAQAVLSAEKGTGRILPTARDCVKLLVNEMALTAKGKRVTAGGKAQEN